MTPATTGPAGEDMAERSSSDKDVTSVSLMVGMYADGPSFSLAMIQWECFYPVHMFMKHPSPYNSHATSSTYDTYRTLGILADVPCFAAG